MKYLCFALLIFLLSCKQDKSKGENAAPTLLTDQETPMAGVVAINGSDGKPMLRPFVLKDSIRLTSGSSSPRAYYEVVSFEAVSANEKLNTAINTALGKVIVGEEAPIKVSNLERTINASNKAALKTYRQQEIDSTLLESMSSAYALDHRFKSEIRHQTSKILTMSTNHYYYTGGAHGNYYSILQSFDLETAELIESKDILLPGNDAKITDLLKEYSEFQSDEIHPTKNIGLTEEGLLFNYPPYEIGSYADGEIEIVLPYDVVRDYLTERGLSLIDRR